MRAVRVEVIGPAGKTRTALLETPTAKSMRVNREVKHDVYGKRKKLNFCRLASALYTVESKYLYLL